MPKHHFALSNVLLLHLLLYCAPSFCMGREALGWKSMMMLVDYLSILLQGFIISDSEGVDRLSDYGPTYRHRVLTAILAGVDMVKMP